jgi:NlpC/P60 family putative phage cell wall peptidase
VSPELRQRVVAEARAWLGTPYHHHGRLRGVGVDCAQLLCAVYAAAGAIPVLQPGAYAVDWHLHRSEEMFLAWVRRAGTERVQAPAPGTAAVFRFGRAYSHGAVMLDEHTALHAYIGQGVILTRLDEAPLKGRPVLFFEVRT